MAFTADDFRELLLHLRSDADASRELRNLVRDPVLEQLGARMGELAAAQRRTEERLEELAAAQRRTEERLAELAAAQHRTEERLAELAAAQHRTEERLAELAAAQRRTEERLEELAAAQRRTEESLAQLGAAQRLTEERLAALIDRVDHLADRVGGLLGDSLERRYRERAGSYFGRLLRKTRVLDSLALETALEERLSPDEMQDSLLTDLIISGEPRTRPEVEEVWLAVEVSSVVDRDDVSRAVRRGRLLTRSGRPVVPVVAGEAITTGADEAARKDQVAVVQDGKIANWDQALEAALGAA